MEPLLNVIALWLSLTLALPAVPGHPEVRHVPPPQLVEIHTGAAAGSYEDRQVVGAYDPLSQTIFLRDDWDSRNPADVSVLVHELVHYLQDRAALRFECAAEREALAYEAQQRWLELYGTDLQRAFGVDAMTRKLRTTCLPH
jgi:hypothetical protein